MSNFPDDYQDAGYVYVTGSKQSEYGHLKAVFRPALLKQYGMIDSVEMNFTAQFGGVSDTSGRVEPSYAWRVTYSSHHSGLESSNLDRVAKFDKKLSRAMETINKVAGDATLLEDHLCRLVQASGVKYVYMADRLDDRRIIPDMDLYIVGREELASVQARIRFLKSLLVKAAP